MKDGANHLGARRDDAGVDPDTEFCPAGQGIGAIDELVPAGELVRRFVAEAEAVLGRVARSPDREPHACPSRPVQLGPGLDLLDDVGWRRRPTGVTLSTVTPASLKAAIRSFT